MTDEFAQRMDALEIELQALKADRLKAASTLRTEPHSITQTFTFTMEQTFHMVTPSRTLVVDLESVNGDNFLYELDFNFSDARVWQARPVMVGAGKVRLLINVVVEGNGDFMRWNNSGDWNETKSFAVRTTSEVTVTTSWQNGNTLISEGW